ncbi:MAG: sigma-70 family RNA polymerase sigma factor [Bacteroidota bacterium]
MHEATTIDFEMTALPQKNITGVIQEYGKRLMGFIRKRVRIEADAEDILQDVFYQLAGNTEPIEQMSAWLYRVTRNKITDKQRKQKPDLIEDVYSVADDETFAGWAELFLDTDNNPELEHLKTIFWNTLRIALDELPEEQRMVFEMNELDGVPFKEIASVTGVTVNTLISRKRYAVLHLRERLGWLKAEILQTGK